MYVNVQTRFCTNPTSARRTVCAYVCTHTQLISECGTKQAVVHKVQTVPALFTIPCLLYTVQFNL